MNQPDAVEWGGAAQQRLDEGTRFGVLAQDLLGGGSLIAADHRHFPQALADTQAELRKSRKPSPRLFEAAFEYQGVRVRVDAFERQARGDTLIEVKSTTTVKDEHIWDCAIQTWVARGAGRKVDRVLLAHVNREFVYRREGDFKGLLTLQDITREVETKLPDIPRIVARLKRVASGPVPDIRTGSHCVQPYECPCRRHCQASEPAPPAFPVDLLPYAADLVATLRADGYLDLRNVPMDRLSNPRHQRIARATRSGKPFVSPTFSAALDALTFPRYYLDFETIAFVTPRWLGTRPFQQVPFQFSCHIEAATGALDHRQFLDLSGTAPMAGFVEALLDVVREKGPILVWNKSFETTRIKELARMFPAQEVALHALIERMVDLLPIYREHYYHRDMRGSWSIKAVLPTVAPDLDYASLEIGDGDAAQAGYLRAIDANASEVDLEMVRLNLLAYCERDTLAMVRLARWRPT